MDRCLIPEAEGAGVQKAWNYGGLIRIGSSFVLDLLIHLDKLIFHMPQVVLGVIVPICQIPLRRRQLVEAVHLFLFQPGDGVRHLLDIGDRDLLRVGSALLGLDAALEINHQSQVGRNQKDPG